MNFHVDEELPILDILGGHPRAITLGFEKSIN